MKKNNATESCAVSQSSGLTGPLWLCEAVRKKLKNRSIQVLQYNLSMHSVLLVTAAIAAPMTVRDDQSDRVDPGPQLTDGSFPPRCAGLARLYLTLCISPALPGFASPYKQGYLLDGVSLTGWDKQTQCHNDTRDICQIYNSSPYLDNSLLRDFYGSLGLISCVCVCVVKR